MTSCSWKGRRVSIYILRQRQHGESWLILQTWNQSIVFVMRIGRDHERGLIAVDIAVILDSKQNMYEVFTSITICLPEYPDPSIHIFGPLALFSRCSM